MHVHDSPNAHMSGLSPTCDGIWDRMTSQQAIDFVRAYLTANVGLVFICEALLQHCLGEPRGKDNMTVMLVRFKTHLLPLPLPPPPLIPPEGSHGDQEQAAAAAGTNFGGSSSASAVPTGLSLSFQEKISLLTLVRSCGSSYPPRSSGFVFSGQDELDFCQRYHDFL